MAQGEEQAQNIWKEYFEDVYNIDTQEQVAVHMCGFDGIRRAKYFGGEPIGRAEVEVSGVVPEDWRSAVIVPLYKDKVKMTECKNYRSISLLSVVGKIYAGTLVDRVHRVNGDLIDDGQEDFRAGRGYVDQIFTLKQIGDKAREKKSRVYVGFIDLKNDRVNRKALW